MRKGEKEEGSIVEKGILGEKEKKGGGGMESLQDDIVVNILGRISSRNYNTHGLRLWLNLTLTQSLSGS